VADVLVTGAGGFIGSHLVEALVSRGDNVRAFVRYNSRGDAGALRYVSADVANQIEVVAGDLRDVEAVSGAARSRQVIYHLGALIAIPYSYLHPREVIETNVMGTLNVLQAARQEHTERVVHVSTSEVYGTAQYVPIDEAHPLQGQSPYSASKIGADKVAESFHRSFGVPVVTVRPFNAYGPRQSARAVIPTIVSQALAGQPIRLGSLAPRRDFTYVTDTAQGMILAAEREEAIGRTINLGSNEDISIGDLVGLILEEAGVSTSVVQEARRTRPEASEVDRLRADATAASELLGWSPAVPLRAGLAHVVAWVREHPELFRPAEYTV
jgi:dTDP-glucose 4,6-dehydratase